jgi:hypothetical protein
MSALLGPQRSLLAGFKHSEGEGQAGNRSACTTVRMIALERAPRLHQPSDDELDAELDRPSPAGMNDPMPARMSETKAR